MRGGAITQFTIAEQDECLTELEIRLPHHNEKYNRTVPYALPLRYWDDDVEVSEWDVYTHRYGFRDGCVPFTQLAPDSDTRDNQLTDHIRFEQIKVKGDLLKAVRVVMQDYLYFHPKDAARFIHTYLKGFEL
jgi:hypothetical protein